MELSRLARRAIDYLIAGDKPRRWAYIRESKLPGGPGALAELLALGLVEMWERIDYRAVTLTPYGAYHFQVEIDESWAAFPLPRDPRKKRDRDGPRFERVEMPSWHRSPIADERTGEVRSCWEHGIVEPKEEGHHELEYPQLVPVDPRDWYTDSDGHLVFNVPAERLAPGPAEVLEGQTLALGAKVPEPRPAESAPPTRAERRKTNASKAGAGRVPPSPHLKGGLLGGGGFVAFSDQAVRIYRAALARERREAKRRRKRSKLVFSDAC